MTISGVRESDVVLIEAGAGVRGVDCPRVGLSPDSRSSPSSSISKRVFGDEMAFPSWSARDVSLSPSDSGWA